PLLVAQPQQGVEKRISPRRVVSAGRTRAVYQRSRFPLLQSFFIRPFRVVFELLNPIGQSEPLVRSISHSHPQGGNGGVEIEVLMSYASGHHGQNSQIAGLPIVAHAVDHAVSLAAQDEDKRSALMPVHARVLMNLLLEDEPAGGCDIL